MAAVSSVDTRIDGLLLGNRNELPGGVCDLVHRRGLWVIGGMVLLPMRIRVIAVEGVARGDREHLSQMVDAIADSLSQGFLVVLSGGRHFCWNGGVGNSWLLVNCFQTLS